MVPTGSISKDVADLIIEKLPNDRDTLKRCSLVSPIFLAGSQKRLFADIRLHQDTQCKNLLAVLTSSPHLATHILHLTISDQSSFVRRQNSTLTSVLEMLPSLQSLSLQYVSWHHLCAGSSCAILEQLRLPNLTSLSFCGLYDFPLDYLAGLSHLKSLSLRFMDSSCARGDNRTNSPVSPQKGQLETLSLGTHSGLNGRLVLDILNQPESSLGISKLRKLSVETFSLDVVDLAGEVMKVASQSLEVFEWRIGEWVWKGQFNPGSIELELTPNLRSIFLEASCLLDKEEDPLPWLISSLEVFPGAENLQMLSITLGDCGGWCLNGMDRHSELGQLYEYHVWPKFDSLLADRRFRRLRKVNIVIMGCEKTLKVKVLNVDISTAITWKMPRLQSAGVLRVEKRKQLTRYHREYR